MSTSKEGLESMEAQSYRWTCLCCTEICSAVVPKLALVNCLAYRKQYTLEEQFLAN